MYGFTIAKVLSVVFLKELVFAKYLFIYIFQQTETFNLGWKVS